MSRRSEQSSGLRALAVPAAGAIGYLAGVLPSAQIVARLASNGVDPQRDGTGNPGAANVAGLLGRSAGAAVFVLDTAKAFGAGRAGAAIAGPVGANVAASAAVIGHCYPATRGFRGGKGVAASFGQMLATFPAYLPIDLGLGVVAARSDVWKGRPVATMAATCGLWTALAALWANRSLPNLWAPRATGALPVAAAVSSAAIVARFAAEAGAAEDRQEPAE